jgi:hypothetical protein
MREESCDHVFSVGRGLELAGWLDGFTVMAYEERQQQAKTDLTLSPHTTSGQNAFLYDE